MAEDFGPSSSHTREEDIGAPDTREYHTVHTTLGNYVDRLIERIQALEAEIVEVKRQMDEMRANMQEMRLQFCSHANTDSDMSNS